MAHGLPIWPLRRLTNKRPDQIHEADPVADALPTELHLSVASIGQQKG
jgi:hypothetical protein